MIFTHFGVSGPTILSSSAHLVRYKNIENLFKERKIILNLTIDTNICPVLDYFEIFMQRTMMSKYAAKYLKVWFELVINGTKLL